MSNVVIAMLWGLIGTALGAAHVAVLWRALGAVEGCESEEAARRLVRGFPLRLIAMVPFLLGAVSMGFFACVGVVVGLLAGRMVAYWFLRRLGPCSASPLTEQD